MFFLIEDVYLTSVEGLQVENSLGLILVHLLFYVY